MTIETLTRLNPPPYNIDLPVLLSDKRREDRHKFSRISSPIKTNTIFLINQYINQLQSNMPQITTLSVLDRNELDQILKH